MPTRRTRDLRKYFDEAMGGKGFDYILKYDKSLEKKMNKLGKKDHESLDLILNRFREYGNESRWKSDTETTGNNSHRSRVGRTKPEDGHRGHVINKIDVDKGHRIFIVRYSDDKIAKTYVILVGILLASQRKPSYTWRDEAARIRQKFGGVVFESENEEVDDLIYDGGKHLTDYGAGFLDKYTPEETESLVRFGLSQIDTNITLTYDQISAVEKVLPLVIDGHAGTGKSVIIALRVALESLTAFGNNEEKNFLVVAYNQRVLNMVKKYAEDWMIRLNPGVPDHVMKRVTYRTTLNVYRDLTKEIHYHSIPEPTSIESISKLVNFFRFDHQFFSAPHQPRAKVSPEQAWHFIRGVLKGSGFGWLGDEVTIQDFASLHNNGRIPKKSTELMDRELILELLEIFNEYEEWRMEQKALDDIDLVRLATHALKNWEDNQAEDSSFKGDEYYKNFDIVFVDEAQDLTLKEYDLLHKLLTDESSARLVIGGDPLQTINPTGFSWDAISVFLYNILEDTIDFERMLVSHRLPKKLVEFANVIIKKRHQFENGDLELMRASNELENDNANIVRVPIDIDDPSHQGKLAAFLTESLGSNYGTLIWARDKGERQALIARDPVLNSLADLSGDDGDDSVERVILHSVESVKGLEYENVIFYRFGDIGLNFKELMDKAGQTDINPSEKYTILYHLNRLFIAATRSKSNIYIFDSQENLDACWNEGWWESTTSILTELENFIDSVNTEPSLEVAKMYLLNARDNNDLDRAREALVAASRCDDSNERNMVLREAEILKIRLELELRNYSDEEIQRKTTRLVELYKENGEAANAIEMMLQLQQWNEVYSEIQKGNLPKSPLMDFYRCMSSLHKKGMGVSSLERILTTHRNQFKKVNPTTKSVFDSRIREHIRMHIQDIESTALRAMYVRWNYTRLDIINFLAPTWKKGDPVACNELKKNFEKKIKAAIGNQSDMNAKEHIAYLNALLGNPYVGSDEEGRLIDKLAERGDNNAGKRRLKEQFIAEDTWEFASTKPKVYTRFLSAIDQGTFSADIDNAPLYEAIKPRLQFHRDYAQIRSPSAQKWLAILRKTRSQVVTQNLNEVVRGSGFAPFNMLGTEGGRIWTLFEKEFLEIDESTIIQLRSNLLHRLYNQKTALREFNNDSTLLKELIEYEAKHSLDVWCEGFKLLKNTMNANDGQYDSSCIFLYCEAIDDTTAKKLPRSLQRQFVNNLRDIILEMKDFEPLRENVHAIKKWMIDLLEKDKLASDVVTRIGLYRLYQIWQAQQMTEDKEPTDDDDDDFPEAIVDVEDILSLAKNIDTELYLMLAKQTGKKAGQIDIAVYLKGLKPGDYSEEEVVEALPSIEEFNLKELSWLRGNISTLGQPLPKQASGLSPFEQLMFGAVWGYNFNSSLMSLNWENSETWEDERMVELATHLDERAMHQAELWAIEHPFWQEAARNEGLINLYKPRRNRVDHEAFAVYATIELLLILSKMNNTDRVAYLRKTWIPSLKSSTKKEATVDAVFELPVVRMAFGDSTHENALDLARELLMQ